MQCYPLGMRIVRTGEPMRYIIGLLALTIVGCYSAHYSDGKRYTPATMADTLAHRAFFARKPTSENWHLRANEQDADNLSVRMNQTSPTYTVSFVVSYSAIPEDPKSSSHFERIVRDSCIVVEDAVRFQIEDIQTEITRRQSQLCVDYSTTVIDNNPANADTALIMYNKGSFMLHPTRMATVVHALITQRGKRTEIDFALNEEMKYLLSNVRMTNPDGSVVGEP